MRIGNTIFLCSEDGIADTVRPRAEAAGADLSKLHVLQSTLVGSNRKRKRFNLQEDLNVLDQVIKRVGNVQLVSVDPITSYMGKIDGSSTNDVRAVLDPVSEFAETLRVSLLGITHPPKNAQGNALRQFTGSFSYVAASRLAFFSIREPETDRLLLLPVKNNIGLKARGIGYRIGVKQISNSIFAPYVTWDDAPVDFTADQAIAAEAASRRDGGALKDAKEFLGELMKDGGPVLATDGEEARNEARHKRCHAKTCPQGTRHQSGKAWLPRTVGMDARRQRRSSKKSKVFIGSAG